MDREAWWAPVHGGHKEWDMTTTFTHSLTLIAALFSMTRNWKQPQPEFPTIRLEHSKSVFYEISCNHYIFVPIINSHDSKNIHRILHREISCLLCPHLFCSPCSLSFVFFLQIFLIYSPFRSFHIKIWSVSSFLLLHCTVVYCADIPQFFKAPYCWILV